MSFNFPDNCNGLVIEKLPSEAISYFFSKISKDIDKPIIYIADNDKQAKQLENCLKAMLPNYQILFFQQSLMKIVSMQITTKILLLFKKVQLVVHNLYGLSKIN